MINIRHAFALFAFRFRHRLYCSFDLVAVSNLLLLFPFANLCIMPQGPVFITFGFFYLTNFRDDLVPNFLRNVCMSSFWHPCQVVLFYFCDFSGFRHYFPNALILSTNLSIDFICSLPSSMNTKIFIASLKVNLSLSRFDNNFCLIYS